MAIKSLQKKDANNSKEIHNGTELINKKEASSKVHNVSKDNNISRVNGNDTTSDINYDEKISIQVNFINEDNKVDKKKVFIFPKNSFIGKAFDYTHGILNITLSLKTEVIQLFEAIKEEKIESMLKPCDIENILLNCKCLKLTRFCKKYLTCFVLHITFKDKESVENVRYNILKYSKFGITVKGEKHTVRSMDIVLKPDCGKLVNLLNKDKIHDIIKIETLKDIQAAMKWSA